MTIVVLKGNQLVADRLLHDGNATYDTCKIEVVADSVYACAGYLSTVSQFMHWIRTGDNPPELPHDEHVIRCIRVDKHGGAWLYTDSLYPIRIAETFHAIGSESGQFAAQCLSGCGYDAYNIVVQITKHNGFSGLDMFDISKWTLTTFAYAGAEHV